MVEGEATQQAAAPDGAPTSPPTQTPAVKSDADTPLLTAEAEKGSEETPVETVAPAEAVVEATAPEAAVEPELSHASEREALDWSHVLGFQSVEAPAEEVLARPGYVEEFAKEIAARAARFARSVDESIVLSSDGLIRWLGDPIARVVAGEAPLKPHAVLLVDEALTGEDRATVENRVDLWISAHVRKVLGPLLALAEGADLPEVAKGLGAKIAEALGVLERDRVRPEVKALDQLARAALRKLGVRFGSLYIYVPGLLKPGARSLCSLLWTLRRGAEPGADRLLAFASAGRTSFANEGLLSPDAYRVAGFRLCGERVVRVDIIERLSDLIRAAIPDHMRFGSRPASEAYGFIVTPQMTSLTGCSGDAFASILRSLGFEHAMVSMTAFEAANRKAPTGPLTPAAAQDEGATASPSDSDSLTAELATGNDAPVSEGDAPSEATAAHGEDAEVQAEEESPTQSDAEVSVESAQVAAAPALDDAAPVEAAAEATVTQDEPVAEHSAEPPGAAEVASPQAAAESTAEGEAPQAAAEAAHAAESTTPVEEELIEIWRPAPRRPRVTPRPQGAEREARNHHGKFRDAKRHDRKPAPEIAAERSAPSEAAAAPVEAPAQVRAERRGEGPRRFEPKGKEEGRSRDDRRAAKDFGGRRESRPAQIDPDSPFAKLAALKPLLERRDKRP